ncbi:MAG: N-acetyl-gamma-glutamyl-phosphate reductase [Acidimicrobiia bacterium]
MVETHTVGIVGARGYTGAEILRHIAGHPGLELAFAGSRELDGSPVPGIDNFRFESIGPGQLSEHPVDLLFLALPDGSGDPYVEGISPDTVIVDISADHRFDDDWAYGLPELFRENIKGARRVANPGCYATAAQLSLAPLLDLIDGVPAVFGVSGYSGAGSTPSPRNDPALLADNLVPYKLVGHNHEREATRHLGTTVRFMPHVHPAFRGLIVTCHVPLSRRVDSEQLLDLFRARYEAEPLIEIQRDPPQLRDGIGRSGVIIGGIATSEDGRNAVVVAAEDNLLKGAAVQAMQNANLALGLPEFSGILRGS